MENLAGLTGKEKLALRQMLTERERPLRDRIAELERKVENLTKELAAADSALSTMRPHYERGTS